MGWVRNLFGHKPHDVDVEAYFDAVRAHYLALLRHAMKDAKSRGGQVLVEAAISLEDEHGADVTPVRPYRSDIICVAEDGNIQPILPVGDHSIPWQPAQVVLGGLAVQVQHFVWNVCMVIGRPAPPEARWAPLFAWFTKWFEHSSPADAPFSGVVHFMSDPELDDDELNVQVDLGSAPTAALVELLHVFSEMGCREGLVYSSPEAILQP